MTDSKARGNKDWFVEARFGLFIHWGLYALAARHEWVKRNERIKTEDYMKYFETFDPDLYDPKQWARLAKQATAAKSLPTSRKGGRSCHVLQNHRSPLLPASR